jgi:polysaccharide pyruvyl transferase CsaB
MVTMMMDMGGAETHILELSKELKKLGYDIIVASNGGGFVKELQENGVKHYKVPLHDKSIGNVIKSYNMLKKIIIAEKVDIVHAHARIPAYICGKLQKKLNFKFVTTAHGTFKTSPLLNFLTNWGERTLAISDDIKEYLIKNYDIKESNIKMTVNGINPDFFSEDIVVKNINNIDKFTDSINILHVSRLENNTSMTVIALINNMDKLLKVNDRIKLIIVGPGKEYEAIKKLAADKNNSFKREVIHVEGAKTNINEYIAISDLFVGISRAALEAMLMKKAVILSGNYGYMGIFTEDKLSEAILNNFTCRKTQAFDENILVEDVIKLINMDKEQREKIESFNKQVVLENYSVERMTDNAVKIYNELCSPVTVKERNINALVFGYIGFNNSGDDAIFDIFSKLFLKKYPESSITVLSNSSDKLANDKIKHVYGFNIFKIMNAIKRNQIIIANGGSLLQDTTSSRSLYYYLSIIWYAKRHNKKVVMLANGLGPINKEFNKKLVKKIVDKVDLITFRDSESHELAKHLGINNPKMEVAADMVFNYKDMQKAEVCSEIFSKEGIPTDRKIIGVMVRPWGNSNKYITDIAKLCDKLIAEKEVNVLFIPMQKTKRINDMLTSQEVIKNMSNKAYVLENTYNYEEISSIIRKMELIISMRLHSIIYALISGVPVYGLAYQPKVKSYLNEANLPVENNLDNIDVEKAFNESVKLMENKDEISHSFEHKIIELNKKAKMNMTILDEYINKWF